MRQAAELAPAVPGRQAEKGVGAEHEAQRTRTQLGAQGCQGVHGVRRTATPDLALVNDKPWLGRHGCAQHLQAQLRGSHRSGAMRRRTGRDQPHGGEPAAMPAPRGPRADDRCAPDRTCRRVCRSARSQPSPPWWRRLRLTRSPPVAPARRSTPGSPRAGRSTARPCREPFTMRSARAALLTRRPMSFRLRPRAARRNSSWRLGQTRASFSAWSMLRPWCTRTTMSARLEDFPHEGPQHQHLGLALSLQAAAGPARCGATSPDERSVAELKDIEAGAVGHALADGLGRDPAVADERARACRSPASRPADCLRPAPPAASSASSSTREPGFSQPSAAATPADCSRRGGLQLDPHGGLCEGCRPLGARRAESSAGSQDHDDVAGIGLAPPAR